MAKATKKDKQAEAEIQAATEIPTAKSKIPAELEARINPPYDPEIPENRQRHLR